MDVDVRMHRTKDIKTGAASFRRLDILSTDILSTENDSFPNRVGERYYRSMYTGKSFSINSKSDKDQVDEITSWHNGKLTK